MDAGPAVPEQVSLGLGIPALLEGDLVGVDLFDLLVIKHQPGLQHELLIS